MVGQVFGSVLLAIPFGPLGCNFDRTANRSHTFPFRPCLPTTNTVAPERESLSMPRNVDSVASFCAPSQLCSTTAANIVHPPAIHLHANSGAIPIREHRTCTVFTVGNNHFQLLYRCVCAHHSCGLLPKLTYMQSPHTAATSRMSTERRSDVRTSRLQRPAEPESAHYHRRVDIMRELCVCVSPFLRHW